MYEHESSVVNRWGLTKPEETGAHRFFNNKRVKQEELIKELQAQCLVQSEGGHALVIQDTVEFNFNHLSGKLDPGDPDIGVISDDRSLGFFAHPGLAIDQASGLPIGISSLSIWSRPTDRLSKEARDYKNQPIEQKESYRWIQTARQSKATLSKADRITVIGDRESDIYELFCSLPDAGMDLLVRTSWDRKLSNGYTLTEHLSTLDWQGTTTVHLAGNKKRSARAAQLKVRWTKIQVAKPKNKKQVLAAYPDFVELHVVELKEKADSVPQGESPVHWTLWTTHVVEDLEKALLIALWYSWRWWIEDFFRILKKQGFELESSQFGTGAALQKLTILTMDQALKVLLMRQERLGNKGLNASACFSDQEQEFLEMLQPELEGNTPKQSNPHPKQSLAWAVWLIARLGGWTPADLTKRPPGVITLLRGLKNFNRQFHGWKLAIKKYHDSSNSSP